MPTFHAKRVNTFKTEQQNPYNNGLTPETESRIGKKTKQLQGPYGEERKLSLLSPTENAVILRFLFL